MAGEINWRQKYQELKAKYMESVDMAFRLGFEQGAKEAQVDQANQQAAQAQSQMQAMQGGANPNQNAPGASAEDPNQPPGEDGNGPSQPAGPGQGIQQPPDSENPQGSELDQHIAKLESMIQKSAGAESAFLQESLKGLLTLKKSFQQQADLKKSAIAIKEISKALHKPAFKLSQQANHNLSSGAKAGASMQQRMVDQLLAKMDSEEKNAGNDILKQLGIEGLVKKET